MEDVVAGSVVDVNGGGGGGVGARIRRRHSANPRLGADGWDGKEGKNGRHYVGRNSYLIDQVLTRIRRRY